VVEEVAAVSAGEVAVREVVPAEAARVVPVGTGAATVVDLIAAGPIAIAVIEGETAAVPT
jgi:hypothetical protein